MVLIGLEIKFKLGVLSALSEWIRAQKKAHKAQ